MAVPRKRRGKRPRYEGAVIKGERAVLTHNREISRNLKGYRAKAAGGGGGGGSDASGGGGGSGAGDDLGRRLREAAEIIARQARQNAGGWSARIPPSIKVNGGSSGISISSSSPPAYPNELGVRHPVFGGRGTRRPDAPWVTNKHRPFLAPAADEKIDEAAEAFSKVLDDWAKELGYK